MIDWLCQHALVPSSGLSCGTARYLARNEDEGGCNQVFDACDWIPFLTPPHAKTLTGLDPLVKSKTFSFYAGSPILVPSQSNRKQKCHVAQMQT